MAIDFVVYFGKWNGTPVALKKMKDQQHQKEFEAECSILFKVGQHPNVVQFLGIYIAKTDYYIVTEFVSGGELLEYMRKNLDKLTNDDFFEMIYGGMAFLESKGIVHRDLAARNLLLQIEGDRYTAKISGFGLSRISSIKNYYKMQDKTAAVPIRWTEPETFLC